MSDDCCNTGRRGLLQGTVGAGLLAATGAFFGAEGVAQAAALTKAERDALTPDKVIQEMLAGNARFLADRRKHRDYLAEVRTSGSGQFPAAIVLSCVDSRAPVEVICDLGIGDTFNARVAGNAVNDDILGSMEFACAAAGAKLVVVMGHTACGAIKGAIDNVVLGNLTLLLARFKAAIDGTVFTGARTSANAAFVDAVAATNVNQTLQLIRARSPVLAELEKKGAIKIVGAMYNVATGKVSMLS